MKKLTISMSVLILSFLVFNNDPTFAQGNFYQGKTIRMIVGFTAGGGYDAYTRTIGRHMGQHISRHPAILGENMPGAGSMISGNYFYKAARPDGLKIGHFLRRTFPPNILGQGLGSSSTPVNFITSKFRARKTL